MYYKISRVAILLALVVLLAGCAPAAAPTPTPKPAMPTPAAPVATPTPSPEKPKYGGTLRSIMAEITGSWDRWTTPHGPALLNGRMIYVSLAMPDYFSPQYVSGYYSETMARRPYAAERWEMPDAKTYIFHLRKGIKWDSRPPTNGREMVAGDVVWNIEQSKKAPGSYKEFREIVDKVEALDKYTVKFTLKEPFAEFVKETDGIDWYLYPPETKAGTGNLDSWENHRGAGPFRLVKYERGQGGTWEKNPDYFLEDPRFPGNKLPYLDKVEMYVIPDIKTRVAVLRAGKVDVMSDFDLSAGIPRDDYLSLKQTTPQLKLHGWASPNNARTYMRSDKPPFSDIRVRRAVSMAIDRDAIKDALTFGEGDPWKAVVGPSTEGRLVGKDLGEAAQWYEYNQKRAKELLTEAGYPNGFATTYTTNANYRPRGYTSAMEATSAYLGQVGIKVDQREIDHASFSATAQKGQYEGMVIHFNQWNYPTRLMAEVLSGWNYGYVTDKSKIKEFWTRYHTTLDPSERIKVSQEIQRFFAEQMYFIDSPAVMCYEGWWPQVKGYNGEAPRSWFGQVFQFAWLTN